ncbi:hypothetical protein DFH27DRAFT_523858 [Peziza echinospora]|nr:hypothetical protein DFH27DRAFT_523858 [Peziza echinospora]
MPAIPFPSHQGEYHSHYQIQGYQHPTIKNTHPPSLPSYDLQPLHPRQSMSLQPMLESQRSSYQAYSQGGESSASNTAQNHQQFSHDRPRMSAWPKMDLGNPQATSGMLQNQNTPSNGPSQKGAPRPLGSEVRNEGRVDFGPGPRATGLVRGTNAPETQSGAEGTWSGKVESFESSEPPLEYRSNIGTGHPQSRVSAGVATQGAPIFRVEDQIADILSTFSASSSHTNSNTSELSASFQNPHDDMSLSTLLHPASNPSLPATIYGLAVSNPAFFQILRDAVPPEYCAISFFKRIEKQAYFILGRHSDYLFSGPSFFEFPSRVSGSDSLAEDEEMCIPDEVWCEKALKRRVSTIHRHLRVRGPLGRTAKEQALQSLIRILWGVVEKGAAEDGDDSGDQQIVEVKASRARQRISNRKKVGIYTRLIGENGGEGLHLAHRGGMMYNGVAVSGSSQIRPHQPRPHVEDGFFILSVMWGLIDVLGRQSERLHRILGKIKEYGARDGFIEEFERILAEGRNQTQSEAASIGGGDLSRRGSADSVKRTRDFSTGDPERPVSRRRVS